jgi:HEAT repeat protein
MAGLARQGGIQEIFDQLYSGNPRARVAALRELGSLGEAGALELDAARRCVELFGDPEHSVQEAAVLALSSMGAMANPYIDEVVNMVSSPDKEVKQAAIQALGYIGGEDQAKIVESFLDDQDLDLVVDACTSLGWMCSASSQQRLMSKLKDSDSSVVAAASASLCHLGCADNATVIQSLKGDVKVKLAVVTALSTIAAKGGQVAVQDELIKPLADLVGDETSQVRIAAANIIGTIGDKAASQAQDLGKLLSSKEIGVRACAAAALAGIGEAASSQADLLKGLLEDEEEDKSALLLSIAGVQPKVASYLRKPACAAALAIAAMGSKGRALAPAVARALKSKDFEIRIACLKALGSMGEDGAKFIDDAMKLVEDPAPLVTATACLAIGSMADNSTATSAAAEKIAECLKDKLPIVRAAACQALAKMGEEAPNYLDVLVKCLTDQAGCVRAAACDGVVACGELGQMYASDICRLIYDSDVNVRCKALASLVQMGERGSAFAEEVASLMDASNPPEIQEAGYNALLSFGPEISDAFLATAPALPMY